VLDFALCQYSYFVLKIQDFNAVYSLQFTIYR